MWLAPRASHSASVSASLVPCELWMSASRTRTLACTAGAPAAAATGALSPEPTPLSIAASLEARSEHPLAAALRDAAAQAGVPALQLEEWRMEPGLGVRGKFHGLETDHLLGSAFAGVIRPEVHRISGSIFQRGKRRRASQPR